jgi:hypothetical protein
MAWEVVLIDRRGLVQARALRLRSEDSAREEAKRLNSPRSAEDGHWTVAPIEW